MPQGSLLTVEEARTELRCGRSKFYELAKEGKIRLLKLGGKSLVYRSDLEKFIDSLAE